MPNLRYLHIGVLVSLCLEAASPWQPWSVPPRDVMADITNDLGICLLQVIGRESRENVAFSPYGVMSIVFLLYEGSHGNTAIEIYNALRLPWDRHMSRIGFRDLHRHIKSYFSNDRFLRGLVLSKPSVPLKTEYVRLLNFYGFYPNGKESSGSQDVPPADSESKGMPENHEMHPTTAPSYIPPEITTRRPTRPTTRQTTTMASVDNEYATSETTTNEFVTKPNINEYMTKPNTNEYVTKPTTNEYTTKQTQDEYTTKPSVNEYTTKPSVNEYTTKPSVNEYTTKQITKMESTNNEYITKPTVNTRPYTNGYVTKQTTRIYPAKTTSYPSTDFENNNSFETDPTIPPYNPTKYPSKTTYYYTTKRKPMRTTTQPSYTFNDISTVKPGYNSHGMTQFFTEETPTAPESTYTDRDNERPTIEDNIIFGNDQQQNGRQPPTIRPTTDSGVYRPPKGGFTDPFITNSDMQYTMRGRTTAKPTTPSNAEKDDEQPIKFPDSKSTTDFYEQGQTSYGKTTYQTTANPNDDKIFYPTDSTNEDNDYIDIRSANLKSTPSPLETVTYNIIPSDMSSFKARSKDISDDNPYRGTSNEAPSFTKETDPTTVKQPISETENPMKIQEENGKIMTRKEVEKANLMVDTINKTRTENPETSSLATILMSVGYSNGPKMTLQDISTKSQSANQIERLSTMSEVTSSGNITNDQTLKKKNERPSEMVENLTTLDASRNGSEEIRSSQVFNFNQTSLPEAAFNGTVEENHLRSKRALLGPPIPYDHRDGSSNWIPPAEGPHWEYNVPRDQWFFTYYGSEPVPVLTYMDYLPFAFIESINTLALKLPLDDPRYSMLILLPMERFGLDQMLAELHQCSIRQVLQDLRATPIYAVLPAFTLVKHINLVPALTSMGIEEVFDSSRADLSGMASEPHLYVKSIEQLVTVSLRKYHYSNRRYDIRPEEVRHHFIANHPFAYFVLDSETNAALMAGTLVSPTAYKQRQ